MPSLESILAKLGKNSYYCDSGVNEGRMHVTMSGYLNMDEYNKLNNSIYLEKKVNKNA